MRRRQNQRRIKKAKRHFIGVCFFCETKGFKLLDAHRILPGEQGGIYHWDNILVVCAGCHRKITVGEIVIHGRHLCTGGYHVVIYSEHGKEFTKPERRRLES